MKYTESVEVPFTPHLLVKEHCGTTNRVVIMNGALKQFDSSWYLLMHYVLLANS